MKTSSAVAFYFLGGCGWARIFYIITVITAGGVVLGDGRHYNTYYVNIAWEWFCVFLAFVFWIGCKWIKKGGLCAGVGKTGSLFLLTYFG
jgi:hypothetical protein